MKISIKSVLLTLLIIFAVILTGSYVFVRVNGKSIIVDRLRQATHRDVEIGQVDFVPPLGVSLKDVQISGYLTVKEVRLGLGVLNLIASVLNQNANLASLDLIEPVVFLARFKDSRIIVGQNWKDEAKENIPSPLPGVQDQGAPFQTEKAERNKVSFFIQKLIVHNGQVHFRDYKDDGQVIETFLNSVELKGEEISFPLKDLNTTFDLLASFPKIDSERQNGYMKGKGWVNWVRKDMEAKFEISELDGRTFKSYYDSFSPEGVKSVTVSAVADLSSRNNDMRVKCLLKIKDLVVDSEKKKDDESISIDDLILAGLNSLGNKELVFNFNFNTKMDSFQIDSVPFGGGVWEAK